METKVLFYGAYYNKSTTETVEINQVIEIPKVVTESTTRRPKRDISEVDLSGNVSVPYVLFIPSNKTQQTTNDGSEYKLNYNMGVAYLSAVAVCLIISLVKVVRRCVFYQRKCVFYHRRGVLHYRKGVLHHRRGILHHRKDVLHHRRGVLHHRRGMKRCIAP